MALILFHSHSSDELVSQVLIFWYQVRRGATSLKNKEPAVFDSHSNIQ